MISQKNVLFVLVCIAALHFVATFFYWYWTYRWIDMPMHFLGGFWVAMAFFYFLYPKIHFTEYSVLSTVLLALSFVVFVGVLWEFYEFLYDFFVTKRIFTDQNLFGAAMRIDMIKDLFFDLFGGSVFTMFFLRKNVKEPYIGNR